MTNQDVVITQTLITLPQQLPGIKYDYFNKVTHITEGDIVALLAGQQTCDSEVAGSSPGWAPLRSGLIKLLTPVCLCHQAV